jgi:hypothetical protein
VGQVSGPGCNGVLQKEGLGDRSLTNDGETREA